MQSVRKYLNFILGLAILFVLSAPQGIMAQPSGITEDFKRKINEVMEILQDEKLKEDPVARRNILRKKINLCFNYMQMARRALAQNWEKINPQERKEFTKLFKDLLERSYASKIETYSGGEIRYKDEIIKGNFALVKTQFLQHGKFVNLDYKLIKEKGDWKVYDFVIKGVSMIRNYRSQFTKIMNDKSFSDLMESLEKSVENKNAIGITFIDTNKGVVN